MDFVCPAPHPAVASALERALAGKRVLALTGAGISTESGIPDYRGPESLGKARRPMLYAQFTGSEEARRRYWARSLVGWLRVHRAAPNPAHQALARLEQTGRVSGVLTQNVDGLHQAAGSREVLELHGSLARVRCLVCAAQERREALQERLRAMNPGVARLMAGATTEIAPDGDAELDLALVTSFRVPGCLRCGGTLKPDVVFFGENVPKARVTSAYAMLEEAEVLLVLGSSLTVFSGYRFVVRAAHEGKAVIIVNQGPTRGDAEAALRVSGRLGEVLPTLAARLLASAAS